MRRVICLLGFSLVLALASGRIEPPKSNNEVTPPWEVCASQGYPESFHNFLRENEYGIEFMGKSKGYVSTAALVETPLVLVIFEYYERPDRSREYIDNFNLFMNYGIVPHSDVIDYVILSGGPDRSDLTRVNQVKANNIVYLHQESQCFAMDNRLLAINRAPRPWRDYTHYAIVNASIRGPYFMKYERVDPVYGWLRPFMERVTDDVKMVGMTMSCDPALHLQTMIMVTDRVGMAILLESGIFSCENCLSCPSQHLRFCFVDDKTKIICNCEIGVTDLFYKYTRFGVDAIAAHSMEPIFGPSPKCTVWSFDDDTGDRLNPLDKGGFYDIFPYITDAYILQAAVR